VLFFIELGTRRVHIAGCTANPTGHWVTQRSREFSWALQEQPSRFRYLIRDRDSKFSRDFDAIFASEGIRIVKTPVRAPKANAFAERFVGTVRRECLDWLLILNRRHLGHTLDVFLDHYNTHRPLVESRPASGDGASAARLRHVTRSEPTRPSRRTHPRIPLRRLNRLYAPHTPLRKRRKAATH
jgi:Integrase core domain